MTGAFSWPKQKLFLRMAGTAAAFFLRRVRGFLIVCGRGGRRGRRRVIGFVESVAAFAFAAAFIFAHIHLLEQKG